VALGSGIRAFFEGPEADIPASWSRDTDFDSIFMQGAPSGENPGASGGGSHSHNESGHFHIHAKHTHPLTVSGDSNLARNTPGYPPEISVSPVVHGHEDTNTLEGGENGESTSIIFDSTEAEPEFIELIVIKPDDENQELPSGVIGFAVNEQIIDLDFEIYTPASGYYIKGAVSTSGGLFGGEEEAPKPTFTEEDYKKAYAEQSAKLEGAFQPVNYSGGITAYAPQSIYTYNQGGLAEIKRFNEGGINYLPSKMTHNEHDYNNYRRASGYVEDGSGNGDKDEDTMLAQLADGEFVSRADAVLGAGILSGASPRDMKDMRSKGANFFYDQQKKFKRIFDLVNASKAD